MSIEEEAEKWVISQEEEDDNPCITSSDRLGAEIILDDVPEEYAIFILRACRCHRRLVEFIRQLVDGPCGLDSLADLSEDACRLR